nr:MAG TPA: hypothetical protein [Bacteriophage sp.]
MFGSPLTKILRKKLITFSANCTKSLIAFPSNNLI